MRGDIVDDVRDIADVDWSAVDFIDLGSGNGKSLTKFIQRIGGRGVGIEINRRKVAEAQRAGRNVVHGDLFDLPGDVSVRYVTMDNVLEHLPNKDAAREALRVACRVAEHFVYIRHPSFEDDAYLRALGLKQYWCDWSGHPAHILLADFMRWFHDLDVRSFVMHPALAVRSSDDPSILPVSAPPDQHDYDPDVHGPKPLVRFSRPVYRQWDVVAVTSPEVSRIRLDYPSDPETSGSRPRVLAEREIAQRLRRTRERHARELIQAVTGQPTR